VHSYFPNALYFQLLCSLLAVHCGVTTQRNVDGRLKSSSLLRYKNERNYFKTWTFFSPRPYGQNTRAVMLFPQNSQLFFALSFSPFRIIADWAIFVVNKLLEIFIWFCLLRAQNSHQEQRWCESEHREHGQPFGGNCFLFVFMPTLKWWSFHFLNLLLILQGTFRKSAVSPVKRIFGCYG
jgi:hypothetical protein